MYVGERKLVINAVAPSRERGLKFKGQYERMVMGWSLLRGSVDLNYEAHKEKMLLGVAPSRERGLKF